MTVKELIEKLKNGYVEDQEIVFEDGEPLEDIYELVETDTNESFVVLKG